MTGHACVLEAAQQQCICPRPEDVQSLHGIVVVLLKARRRPVDAHLARKPSHLDIQPKHKPCLELVYSPLLGLSAVTGGFMNLPPLLLAACIVSTQYAPRIYSNHGRHV